MCLASCSNYDLEMFISEASTAFGYPADVKICSDDMVADRALDLLKEALGLI